MIGELKNGRVHHYIDSIIQKTKRYSVPAFTMDESDKLELPPRPKVEVKENVPYSSLYTTLEILGTGRFGTVKKCERRNDQLLLAAKFIKKTAQSKKEAIHEIEMMNHLHHKRIISLFDAFETHREIILIMELVTGGELFERVIAEDYLSEDQVIWYTRQILHAVQHMHKKNMVHLDLKPENILCLDGGVPGFEKIKLVDFGLATVIVEGEDQTIACGTAEFIAPEVINYEPVTVAADMWSLGVIVYVLISGLSPFAGDDDRETLENVRSGEYDFEDDDEIFESVSENAIRFIEELLVLDKTKRLTVEECLHHRWFKHQPYSSKVETTNLKQYVQASRWKRAFNIIKAVNRFGEIIKWSPEKTKNPYVNDKELSKSERIVETIKRNEEIFTDISNVVSLDKKDVRIFNRSEIPEKKMRMEMTDSFKEESVERFKNDAAFNSNVNGEILTDMTKEMLQENGNSENLTAIDRNEKEALSPDAAEGVTSEVIDSKTKEETSIGSLTGKDMEVKNDETNDAIQSSTKITEDIEIEKDENKNIILYEATENEAESGYALAETERNDDVILFEAREMKNISQEVSKDIKIEKGEINNTISSEKTGNGTISKDERIENGEINNTITSETAENKTISKTEQIEKGKDDTFNPYKVSENETISTASDNIRVEKGKTDNAIPFEDTELQNISSEERKGIKIEEDKTDTIHLSVITDKQTEEISKNTLIEEYQDNTHHPSETSSKETLSPSSNNDIKIEKGRNGDFVSSETTEIENKSAGDSTDIRIEKTETTNVISSDMANKKALSPASSKGIEEEKGEISNVVPCENTEKESLSPASLQDVEEEKGETGNVIPSKTTERETLSPESPKDIEIQKSESGNVIPSETTERETLSPTSSKDIEIKKAETGNVIPSEATEKDVISTEVSEVVEKEKGEIDKGILSEENEKESNLIEASKVQNSAMNANLEKEDSIDPCKKLVGENGDKIITPEMAKESDFADMHKAKMIEKEKVESESAPAKSTVLENGEGYKDKTIMESKNEEPKPKLRRHFSLVSKKSVDKKPDYIRMDSNTVNKGNTNGNGTVSNDKTQNPPKPRKNFGLGRKKMNQNRPDGIMNPSMLSTAKKDENKLFHNSLAPSSDSTRRNFGLIRKKVTYARQDNKAGVLNLLEIGIKENEENDTGSKADEECVNLMPHLNSIGTNDSDEEGKQITNKQITAVLEDEGEKKEINGDLLIIDKE